MKTVPTQWIEGPAGVLSVRTVGPKQFDVWDSNADGDTNPLLFSSGSKAEAIGWAKCKVGITHDEEGSTPSTPSARIARYLAVREHNDQTIHALHGGDQVGSAALQLDDLRALLSELDTLRDQVGNAMTIEPADGDSSWDKGYDAARNKFRQRLGH